MKKYQVVILQVLLLALSACSEKKTEAEELLSDTTTTTTTTSTTSSTTTTTTLAINRKKVALGSDKTFAINASNVANSWGANVENSNGSGGQLGQGLVGNTVVSSPTALDDVGTTYISITSSEITGCGLTSTQKVKCWASLGGDGSGAEKTSPTLINDGGSATYIDISSGSYHSCAVSSTGVLSCWGDGWDGKLGNADGTGATQNSPVIADAGTSYKRVATGRNHSCGITVDGAVKCWGTNSSGQLGDTTTTTPRLTPVSIDAGTTYTEISAGEDTTCGITTAGVLKCWGGNGSGQIGDNSTSTRSTPTVIDAGETYSKISVGGSYAFHTCGITTAGVLKCWGENGSGQLGIGNTTPSLIPVVVDAGTSYSSVAVHLASSCGITTGGVLKCWGANGRGQLGLGHTNNVVANRSPVTVGAGY